jgi:hypothetical protein
MKLTFVPVLGLAMAALFGCGGAGVMPVYNEVTLEVDGSRTGPDLWITRNTKYWSDYDDPCQIDFPASWCTTSFNTTRFDVQPSYTTYRVFVRNFADADRLVRTTVRRRRDDGSYDVYRSILTLGPKETREAWELGITFTKIINGE